MSEGSTRPPCQEKVTICRMVHWFPHVGMGDRRCRAAVVTNVPDPENSPDMVNVHVFGGAVGPGMNEFVYHGNKLGQWHWPAECPYPPHGHAGRIAGISS